MMKDSPDLWRQPIQVESQSALLYIFKWDVHIIQLWKISIQKWGNSLPKQHLVTVPELRLAWAS